MIKKKICLVGAFAVGKTSLVQRYVHSIFSDKYLTTVGVKIDSKEVVLKDRTINLIIWDLHGEDDFQSVRASYLRGAAGCIYVVDNTRPATMDVAIDLRKRVTATIGQVPSILAINKCDLAPQWELDAVNREHWVKQCTSVLQTSAKTGHYVEHAFHQLTAAMIGA